VGSKVQRSAVQGSQVQVFEVQRLRPQRFWVHRSGLVIIRQYVETIQITG